MAFLITARLRRSERGAEVIEFALVLPLLLLIVFGIVDFGFLFQRYVVVTNAAMEGARVAVLPGYAETDAEARAVSYLQQSGVNGTVNCPTPGVGQICADAQASTVPGVGGATWPAWEVTVTYVHEYSYVGPITSMFGAGLTNTRLTARAKMRSQVGAAPAGGGS
jgi:Flp pilus assembly protein TadG